jgi:energy-coupling factor transporter transmembrane protein EcfT
VAGDIQIRAWMAKARGLGDKPAFLRVLQTTISVLVLAITRSETLARAMQARGFGRAQPRTFYRHSNWAVSDTLWILGGAVLGICALGAAIVTGNFNAIIR